MTRFYFWLLERLLPLTPPPIQAVPVAIAAPAISPAYRCRITGRDGALSVTVFTVEGAAIGFAVLESNAGIRATARGIIRAHLARSASDTAKGGAQ